MGILSAARLARPLATTRAVDQWRAEGTPLPTTPRPASAAPLVGGGPSSSLGALGASSWFIPRQLARRVPAIKRCRNVVSGSIASMDLVRWEDGRRAPIPNGSDDVTDSWLRRPQPSRTRSWLIAWTVEDLIMHDRAHWLVRAWRAGTRTPAAVERIPPEEVTPDTKDHSKPAGKEHTHWWIRGVRTPVRDVITFYGSGVGGILYDGADTIFTALELEAAVKRYATSPAPSVVLRNLGIELDDTEQEELLQHWEESRARRSTAFINANVSVETQGWNARELQLVEGRQHAALEVARMMNVPARYALAPSGESLTYSTTQSERRDLADLTLQPYLDVIGQTLSVDAEHDVGWTCCARGRSIALDPAVFLRLSDLERAQLWPPLITSGVLTPEQAQEHEPLSPRRNPNA